MKIAIIGTGNVGTALAHCFLKSGHQVTLGVRDQKTFKGVKAFENTTVTIRHISEAAESSDIIVVAAVPQAVRDIAVQLGNVREKIIIDTMNSFRAKPPGFSNTTEALTKLTGCLHVVKCFNTTGAENLADPIFNTVGIDMFYAGASNKAKQIASQLCKEMGFGEVYDFGGSDNYILLEQFALTWVNLAVTQGLGRGLAFKILKK